MAGKQLQRELSSREAVEDQLASFGEDITPEELLWETYSDSMSKLDDPNIVIKRIQEDYPSLIAKLNLPGTPVDFEKINEFSKTNEPMLRLELLAHMRVSDAVVAVLSTSTVPDIVDRVRNRLGFYDRLAREQEAPQQDNDDGWGREVHPWAVERGLFRDVVHTAMLGTPERAIYNRAKRKCEEAGLATTHMPEMRGVHSGIKPGPDNGSVGKTYSFLHELYEKVLKMGANKEHDNGRNVERDAIQLAADLLVDSMRYNDPGRSPFSVYTGSPEEGIVWARLGKQVQGQLRGMRRKIRGSDFHNLKRFIGRSGDNPYFGQMNNLRKQMTLLEESENESDRQKLLALQNQEQALLPAYERGKSLAQLALDLHFRFTGTDDNHKPFQRLIDWMNDASFGVIKRAHRALCQNMSDAKIIALSIATIFEEGSVSRESYEYLVGIAEHISDLFEKKATLENHIAEKESRLKNDLSRIVSAEIAEHRRELDTVLCSINEKKAVFSHFLPTAQLFSEHGHKLTPGQVTFFSDRDHYELEGGLKVFTLDELLSLHAHGKKSIHNGTVLLDEMSKAYGLAPSFEEIHAMAGHLGHLEPHVLRAACAGFASEEVRDLIVQDIDLTAACGLMRNSQQYGKRLVFESLCATYRELTDLQSVSDLSQALACISIDQIRTLYTKGISFSTYYSVHDVLLRRRQAPSLDKEVLLIEEGRATSVILTNVLVYASLNDVFHAISLGVTLEKFQEIQNSYNKLLLNFSHESIGDLYVKTSVLPIIKPETLKGMASSRERVSLLSTLEELSRVPQLKESLPVLCENIAAQQIEAHQQGSSIETLAWADEHGYKIEYARIALRIKTTILGDPRIVERTMALVSRPSQDIPPAHVEVVKNLKKALQSVPWCEMIHRLSSLQRPSAKEQHDPWLLELYPLLNSVSRIISLENDEDATLIYQFVQKFGMVNLSNIFELFVECSRAKTVEDISEHVVRQLQQLGISVSKGQPSSLIEQVRRVAARMQSELLSDQIPDGLETVIGADLLKRLIKNSSWGASESTRKQFIQQWRETVARTPDAARLPVGYEESTFSASSVQANFLTLEDESDREQSLRVFLTSKEVAEIYLPMAKTLHALETAPGALSFCKESRDRCAASLAQY